MRLELSEDAKADLESGRAFYERQSPGLGEYFLDTLFSDLESLHLYAGTHPKKFGRFHRLLSKRFPFAIYYEVEGDLILVGAILDCRRKPMRAVRRLRRR